MKKSIIKTVALTLSVGAFLMSTGCTKTELVSIQDKASTELVSIESVEPQIYTAYGRYYTDGNIITNATDDGHDAQKWNYSTDLISNQTPYDGMPVRIIFSDNCTPNDITDDVPLNLVYDRNTAIYDELETALSDKFELERDGNNIHIKGGAIR